MAVITNLNISFLKILDKLMAEIINKGSIKIGARYIVYQLDFVILTFSFNKHDVLIKISLIF